MLLARLCARVMVRRQLCLVRTHSLGVAPCSDPAVGSGGRASSVWLCLLWLHCWCWQQQGRVGLQELRPLRAAHSALQVFQV